MSVISPHKKGVQNQRLPPVYLAKNLDVILVNDTGGVIVQNLQIRLPVNNPDFGFLGKRSSNGEERALLSVIHRNLA